MVRTMKRINSSMISIVLILAMIFLFILYCNHLTPYSGDDYAYMYSFADRSKIDGLSSILTSLKVHRYTMNGRLIPHFFVHLFLMYPKMIFNFVNALVFTLFLYLIYRHAFPFSGLADGEQNLLLLLTIFGVVWVRSFNFGSMYLWLDGSINYLWCELLLLIWLIPPVRHFMNGKQLGKMAECFYIILSLVIGNYCENISVSAIFLCMVFLALTKFYRKETLRRWQLLSFASALIGFFLLAFTPAEMTNKITRSFASLINNFVVALRYYLMFWPLLVFLLLGYLLHFRLKLERDTRILSLAFFAASLAAHFVLTFAAYFPVTVANVTLLYLLLACGVLYQPLFQTHAKSVLCLVSILCLCFTAYWSWIGLKDLRLTHYRYENNEALIREQIDSGETKLRVPYIIPDTPYSDLYVWQYLRMDPSHSINQNMAKYYGVEEITGYWFYDAVF